MNESEFWVQCQSGLLLCYVVKRLKIILSLAAIYCRNLCNTPLDSRLLFFAASSSLVSLRMSWWAIASLLDASSRSRSSHWRSFLSREISLWAYSKREEPPEMRLMLMPCEGIHPDIVTGPSWKPTGVMCFFWRDLRSPKSFFSGLWEDDCVGSQQMGQCEITKVISQVTKRVFSPLTHSLQFSVALSLVV